VSGSRAVTCLIAVVAVVSCNLDTTSPNDLPHFSPAWRLVSIDSQPLPDTLGLVLANSPPGTLHAVEVGTLEFVFPASQRRLRWSLSLQRLTDLSRFVFSFDAAYVQFGADSIVFPTSRFDPAEFFGAKVGDTLTVVSIWSGDSATTGVLVGSHRWRFARDTSFPP